VTYQRGLIFLFLCFVVLSFWPCAFLMSRLVSHYVDAKARCNSYRRDINIFPLSKKYQVQIDVRSDWSVGYRNCGSFFINMVIYAPLHIWDENFVLPFIG
jgi:hypothetical protein